MAATTLDAIVQTTGSYATNFAVSSASDRWAFVFIGHQHGSDAAVPTSITLGGQAPTVVTDSEAAGNDVTMSLALWNEAAVAAMSGSALSISGGASDNKYTIHGSIQDSDQSSPAPVEASTLGTSGAISLARVADGFTVAASIHDVTNNFTSFGNPSLTAQASAGGSTAGYGSEAATEETVDFTWANSFSRDNASIAVTFAPAGAAGPAITSVTDPATDTIVAVMDNPVTVTTIEIAYGAHSVLQSSWSSEAEAPDDEEFTINLDRDEIKPLGAIDVEFYDGGLITSVATNLSAPVGSQAVIVASPVADSTGLAGFMGVGSDAMVDDDQIELRHSVGGLVVTLNADTTLEFNMAGPFSFEARPWQDSSNTFGSWRTFNVDEDGNISVSASFVGQGFYGREFTSTGFIGQGF